MRQKQKAAPLPSSNGAAPPLTSQRNVGNSPPSAPPLTDLPSQEEEEQAASGVKSRGDKIVSNHESEKEEAWNGSVSGRAGVSSWSSFPRIILRQVLRRLSSLRLAIAELIVIAGLSALGAVYYTLNE